MTLERFIKTLADVPLKWGLYGGCLRCSVSGTLTVKNDTFCPLTAVGNLVAGDERFPGAHSWRQAFEFLELEEQDAKRVIRAADDFLAVRDGYQEQLRASMLEAVKLV